MAGKASAERQGRARQEKERSDVRRNRTCFILIPADRQFVRTIVIVFISCVSLPVRSVFSAVKLLLFSDIQLNMTLKELGFVCECSSSWFQSGSCSTCFPVFLSPWPLHWHFWNQVASSVHWSHSDYAYVRCYCGENQLYNVVLHAASKHQWHHKGTTWLEQKMGLWHPLYGQFKYWCKHFLEACSSTGKCSRGKEYTTCKDTIQVHKQLC